MAWSQWFEFTSNEVANEAPTTPGVFCLARKGVALDYSRGASRTVFIGVADDAQRGLRAVLGDIADRKAGRIEEERASHGGLRFCFQANLGATAMNLHQALLNDFEGSFGELPRCNGRL